jgi:virginiamycin B lyase
VAFGRRGTRRTLDWRLPAAALLGSAMLAGALSGAASASLTPQLYWTNSTGFTHRIAEANLDGSSANQDFISGASTPLGVAVDGLHLYWANAGSNTIGRASLDGTSVNESFISASFPVGIAVDGSHIYWANASANTIGEANLDGSGVDQSFIVGAASPAGVAVDASHIYWANVGSNTVGRANLDGTNVDENFITGANVPAGVAVNASHIYWANAGVNAIGEANIDGTDPSQTFITGASIPRGVTVDSTHIYWANNTGNTIAEANLDGTSVNQSFIAGASAPYGVAVLTVPGAPTGVSASAEGGQASVAFTAPSGNGSAVTSYTVTADPGGQTSTGTASPIAVTGLAQDTEYTFTVTATNGVGTGSPSEPSNSVVLIGPPDAAQSSLTPTTSNIAANGSSTQMLTVQVKDAGGIDVNGGGATVTITKSSGSGSIGSVTDNGDGTYTATVTAPASPGSGTFVATVDGDPVEGDTGSQTPATIHFFPQPTIAAFTPGSGGIHATVTLTGTNLTGTTHVRLNGTSAAFSVISATELTFTVPDGATTGTITVANPGATATSADSFTVASQPGISGFSPGSGPVGTTVTVTGTNLTGTVGVMLGSVITVPTSVDDSHVTFTIPPGAPSGRIRILATSGSAASVATFTVTG